MGCPAAQPVDTPERSCVAEPKPVAQQGAAARGRRIVQDFQRLPHAARIAPTLSQQGVRTQSGFGRRSGIARQAHSGLPARVQAVDHSPGLLPPGAASRRGRGDDGDRPVRGAGIRTTDGRLHEADIVVLATGFNAHDYVRPATVRTHDGQTLDDMWSAGPRAHKSVAVQGMPNLFMLLGPHSPIGNFSLVQVAEAQAAYVLRWITGGLRGVRHPTTHRRCRRRLRGTHSAWVARHGVDDRLQQLVPGTRRVTGAVALSPAGLSSAAQCARRPQLHHGARQASRQLSGGIPHR